MTLVISGALIPGSFYLRLKLVVQPLGVRAYSWRIGCARVPTSLVRWVRRVLPRSLSMATSASASCSSEG